MPVGAFGNLIQALADDAAASHHEPFRPPGRVPRYLGEALARGEDTTAPRVRAEELRSLLHERAYNPHETWEDDGRVDIDEQAEMLDLIEIDHLGGLDP